MPFAGLGYSRYSVWCKVGVGASGFRPLRPFTHIGLHF